VRRTLPVLLLYAALLFVSGARSAVARPEFARREKKACGYCHINPRGGGPRNERGLEYARNDFRFPEAKSDPGAITREEDKDAFARVDQLLDLDQVPAAVKDLKRLAKTGRKDDPARRLADQRLHELEVKGTEILGRARLLVRGSRPDEGVELLLVVTTLYKDLEIGKEAQSDLRDLRRDPDQKERIAREEREAKARLLYLDGLLQRVDGHAEQGERTLHAVAENYEGSRAAKLALAALEGKDAADVAEAEAAAAKARGGN